MCRNIKNLFNFDPPVTDEEIRSASLQFVRKICGFTKPSKANEASFLAAVEEVAGISKRLLQSLETSAPAKNREEEAAKAKARAAQRIGLLSRLFRLGFEFAQVLHRCIQQIPQHCDFRRDRGVQCWIDVGRK